MAGKLLGYEFLREHLDLSAFPCARPARISSVTKVLQRPDGLNVPASVAPATQAPLEHILFALKPEGVNPQVLAQSLPQVAGAVIKMKGASQAANARAFWPKATRRRY